MAMDMAWIMGVNVRKGWGFWPSRYSERSSPNVWVGVGLIDDNAFDVTGKGRHHCAHPPRFHLGQRLRLDLQVPGIVGFTGFQHGLRCRLSVAPSDDNNTVEIWSLAPVERVALIDGLVVGCELDDSIGAGTQRGGVLCVTGPCRGPNAVGELRLTDNRRAGAHESTVWVGSRSIEP